MGTRRRPWAESQYQIIQQVKLSPQLTGNLLQDARGHEALREEIVAELLCNLYLMATKRIITPESAPIITCEKAARQAVSSTGSNQAAHCAPGQVLITGLEPSSLLLRVEPGETPSLDRILAASRLNALFARTEDLHKNFNYVDSRLEENGMRDALGLAAATVVKEGLDQPRSSRLDREIVLHCFGLYKQYATESGDENLTPYDLAYEHIEQKESSKENEERLLILSEEAKVAEDYQPEKLEPHAIAYTEKVLEDV